MPLFPELRQYAKNNQITIAVSHSNLGPSDATWHLDQWAFELMDYARAQGYNVIDIGGSDLIYEKMTQILSNTHPAILFNFSHGCRTYLMGNDMRCTLTRGQEDGQSCGVCGMSSNMKAISGTAIVAFSCHSAAQLGKCAVAYGSPAYVGFSDNLIVVSDKYGMQNIFKDTLLPLAKRILDGWTIGDSVEKTRKELYDTVKLYKPVELLAVGLWYDRKYLMAHGDINWRMP